MSRHIIVTGGSGYVGRHLISRLAMEGNRITNLDIKSPWRINAGEQWIKRDIAPIAGPLSADEFSGADCVIHLAALINAAESVTDGDRYRHVNGRGTRCVLDATIAAGVPRFIFASSAAVYGAHNGKCDETTTTDPANPYGATKLAGEMAGRGAQEIGDIAEVVNLRFFNIMGINSRLTPPSGAPNLFKNIARRAVHGEVLDIFGTDHPTEDGYAIRDFIHVEDIVDALMKSVNAPQINGTFNIGSGSPTSLRQVIEAAQIALPSPLALRMQPRREGEVSYSLASIAAAEARLGWAPRRSSDLVSAIHEEYEAALFHQTETLLQQA